MAKTVNELTVRYETSLGEVMLDAETVKKFLVKGNTDITDQEVKLFIELCKYQKLNPFVGECYPIKFKDEFQIVIGYETYKRRAEENPAYIGRKSGIVVQRGENIVQKEGTCLYPTETLIGGWCRVFHVKRDKEVETFKEVGFSEYNKGFSNWKSKPCTMIEKVAVSQALRAAFPKDYEGMYTEAELIETTAFECDANQSGENIAAELDLPITQEERKMLFNKAHSLFGKEDGNTVIKELLKEKGLESTIGITKKTLCELDAELDATYKAGSTEEIPSENEDSVE